MIQLRRSLAQRKSGIMAARSAARAGSGIAEIIALARECAVFRASRYIPY